MLAFLLAVGCILFSNFYGEFYGEFFLNFMVNFSLIPFFSLKTFKLIAQNFKNAKSCPEENGVMLNYFKLIAIFKV